MNVLIAIGQFASVFLLGGVILISFFVLVNWMNKN